MTNTRLPFLRAAAFLLSILVCAAISGCGKQPDGIVWLSSGDAVSASHISIQDMIPQVDEEVSSADIPSESDVVVYYNEVHIDGITLPEEYGAGLLDEDAAMWLINEYRRMNGRHELLIGDFHLSLVTDLRLEECMEQFSHDRPDGSRFSTAYSQVGINYRFCAENLAFGQYTAEEAVRDWIQSPSHRDNLLSPNVSYLCVKTALGEDGIPRWVFEAYSAG